jgi:neutral trehalase
MTNSKHQTQLNWATKLKKRWLSFNEKVNRAIGKMTEKDDVWNQEGEASGGEYPNQDGFG